ncbi:PstS family phosphate ABC transporter substrate-binding protein [Aquipuribacter sp. MA13-6]|uniref:PstS family phosphate ABC transporter substrate-binding protein n=1 Tax=unclassified Aquipuribacter TaxID=2635084 RepID=UPI003EEEE806
MKRSTLTRGAIPVAVVLSFALAACGDDGDATDTATDAGAAGAEDTEGGDAGGEAVSGSIAIDGSSTVGPLTDALSEEYAAVQPDVIINLGISGTGGGFERFCGTGDTDISNASRAIEEDEVALCEENGIEFTEIRVGTDALTMVVNPANDFVTCLTTDEIVSIWGPDGVSSWDQVNPEFPAEPLEVFAPGADSGTYDFFNETILEPSEIEEPRQDFNASEDDNVIAQGVIGTPTAWGFFGFSYFQENTDTVKAVEFDAGEGCVAPSVEAAQDGSYGLTRPLFIYLKNEALERPEVADFATFYLDTVNSVIEDVNFIPATDEEISEAQQNVADAIAASEG